MADTQAAALVVVLGGYMTTVFGRSFYYGWSSPRWPVQSAHVLGSEVAITNVGGRRGPVNLESAALVRYAYEVREQAYVGDCIQFGPNWWWLARREVRRYPPHSVIQIHVDPRSPQRSVLRPGLTWSNVLTLPLGIGVLVTGLVWLLRSLQ